MRAWVYYGNKDIRLKELDDPKPGPGQVSVRIAYNGICGTDLHEYFHGPMFVPLESEHPVTGHRGPVTIGHEASGTISAVGDGIDDLSVGQRVVLEPVFRQPNDDAWYNLGGAFYGIMAPGFLADSAVVPRRAVHILPENVDLAAGALTEPLAVAWHAATKTQLQPGSASIVFGGGPIGIGSLLSLQARGVTRLGAVEPSQTRRDLLDTFGVQTFDPFATDYKEALADFAGNGIDAGIDAAGVPSAIHDGLSVLGPEGRLVVVAVHSKPVTLEMNDLLLSEKSIITSMGYRNDFPQVLEHLSAGNLPTDSWVEKVAFEDLVDHGIDRLHSGEAIKVLVEVAGE